MDSSSQLEMLAGDVHVWQAALDLPVASVERLSAVLSDDERRRAGRFHFERDRRRFVVARAVLRSVLGQYLSRRPQDIEFFYEPAGKPYLPPLNNERKFQFNVSHSSEVALIGLCLEDRIGIDVEFKEPDGATLSIARRFFAPEEVSALAALPPEAQCSAFFRTWTLKEAYIKGRGEGVSLGLDTFAVTVDGRKPPSLTRSSHGDGETGRWRFWTIDAGPSYAAALAVEGVGERRISFWNATPEAANIRSERGLLRLHWS